MAQDFARRVGVWVGGADAPLILVESCGIFWLSAKSDIIVRQSINNNGKLPSISARSSVG